MNQKIRALIVDDESLAREALAVMLGDDPDVEVIAECRNGREAVRAIREQSPELVFLDIQMPEMDGFQVIEEVGVDQMPVTIFVTAYDKHALRAFAAHALDYLLKPFDHDRFHTAVHRAKTLIRHQKLGEIGDNLLALLQKMGPSNAKRLALENKEPIDRVAIRSGGRIYFLQTDAIDWVEGAGDYLSLHSGEKAHLIRETMAEFYSKLDARKFLRIHRSTIVNIEKIKEIHPMYKGEYIIALTNGKRFKSSRGYRNELRRILDDVR